MQCALLHAWSQSWRGFSDKQMNQAPFLKPSGNDMHGFHAAPKSSSVKRILREVGARKMLSLLFSSNSCGNSASTFSMEIQHKLPNPGLNKDGLWPKKAAKAQKPQSGTELSEYSCRIRKYGKRHREGNHSIFLLETYFPAVRRESKVSSWIIAFAGSLDRQTNL